MPARALPGTFGIACRFTGTLTADPVAEHRPGSWTRCRLAVDVALDEDGGERCQVDLVCAGDRAERAMQYHAGDAAIITAWLNLHPDGGPLKCKLRSIERWEAPTN